MADNLLNLYILPTVRTKCPTCGASSLPRSRDFIRADLRVYSLGIYRNVKFRNLAYCCDRCTPALPWTSFKTVTPKGRDAVDVADRLRTHIG